MRNTLLITLAVLLSISGSVAEGVACPAVDEAGWLTDSQVQNEPEPIIGSHFLDVKEADTNGRLHKLLGLLVRPVPGRNAECGRGI